MRGMKSTTRTILAATPVNRIPNLTETHHKKGGFPLSPDKSMLSGYQWRFQRPLRDRGKGRIRTRPKSQCLLANKKIEKN
jgi:hypothetical protein